MAAIKKGTTDIQRFNAKVHKTDTCWLWTGSKNRHGYGLIRIRYQGFHAHRLAFVLFKGAIPAGMCVCHTCDTPGCVNPDHLWLGSPKDNASDRDKKGRTAKGSGKPLTSRLDEHSVGEMRDLARLGWTRKRLAARFSVSTVAVVLAVNGDRWRHVTSSPPLAKRKHTPVTTTMALEIRRLAAEGHSYSSIAKKYSIDPSAVSRRVSGITGKRVLYGHI